MSAREDLAKLLFTTDNINAKDPEWEWATATQAQRRYVYEMADAVILAGWTQPGHAEGVGELPAPTPTRNA